MSDTAEAAAPPHDVFDVSTKKTLFTIQYHLS
jgi:hypothetical protein